LPLPRRLASSTSAGSKAQAAGLKPGQLHPLERPAYDQLLARFGPK
jgi:hypothetical protein